MNFQNVLYFLSVQENKLRKESGGESSSGVESYVLEFAVHTDQEELELKLKQKVLHFF